MLRTIIASSLILLSLVYFGCKNENSTITSSSPVKNVSKITVGWNGHGTGTQDPTTYCMQGTTPSGRLGVVTGQAAHMGNFTSIFKYCVQYTSQTHAYIINPNNLQSVITGQDGDEVWFYMGNTDGGDLNVVGTIMIDGILHYIVTANGHGDVNGGTGKFQDAEGEMNFDAYLYVNSTNYHGYGDLKWKGTLTY